MGIHTVPLCEEALALWQDVKNFEILEVTVRGVGNVRADCIGKPDLSIWHVTDLRQRLRVVGLLCAPP